MTAKEAFLRLINDKEYLLTLPKNERDAIFSYKSKLKKGTLVFKNIDTLLEKHGYTIVQEAQWRKTKKVEAWLVDQMHKN